MRDNLNYNHQHYQGDCCYDKGFSRLVPALIKRRKEYQVKYSIHNQTKAIPSRRCIQSHGIIGYV